MVETVIVALILIGIVVGLVVLALWALSSFGLQLPARVVQIAWVIAVLVILLILWRTLSPLLPVTI